ncbi:MAG: hypothetical protein ACI9J3_003616 [Parvicellaceae bacterium]
MGRELRFTILELGFLFVNQQTQIKIPKSEF